MPHGYTYSAHPVAAAAGLATLDVYKEEGLFQRAAELTPYLEDAVHSVGRVTHYGDGRTVSGAFAEGSVLWNEAVERMEFAPLVPRAPAVNVDSTSRLIRCLDSSAASMSTPADL